ncbi:MAG: TrkH family potassium uptake protein [Alphaproteobacteria bacterium]|nr:TrkH family potassium uptake protein [Alphaproteobacteria bacterium]
MDLRSVANIVGYLLGILALAMLVPAAYELLLQSPNWTSFVISAAITGFAGITLSLTTRTKKPVFSVRHAFVFTTVAWASVCLFGAMPFVFGDLGLSLGEAVFEATSGITTTGSTVMTGLDLLSPGFLLWRALLQWLGGVGIVVTAMSLLPALQIGGMQLFRTESFEQTEKLLPRAGELSLKIIQVYVSLTLLAGLVYALLGMSPFDAVVHAMTSIATGGFSNHDSSFAHFESAAIEGAAIVFMLAGSLPFLLYIRLSRREMSALRGDSQMWTFLMLVGVGIALLTLWQVISSVAPFPEALRHAAFNTTSIITGTGYASADYSAWGAFPNALLLVAMFIGGCAGSTSCGIKVFRFQVLYITSVAQVRRLAEPRRVRVTYYNRKPLTDEVAESVQVFFFLFILTFGVLAAALGFMGLDMVTAISSAATAVANVGPGLGPVVGPSSTFASLPEAAKWMMAAGMLLGRLELFSVLVLLVPSFWRE